VKGECIESLLALKDCRVDRGRAAVWVSASGYIVWGEVPYSHEVVGIAIDAVGAGRGRWWFAKDVRSNGGRR
jgi:hypothetical protein